MQQIKGAADGKESDNVSQVWTLYLSINRIRESSLLHAFNNNEKIVLGMKNRNRNRKPRRQKQYASYECFADRPPPLGHRIKSTKQTGNTPALDHGS